MVWIFLRNCLAVLPLKRKNNRHKSISEQKVISNVQKPKGSQKLLVIHEHNFNRKSSSRDVGYQMQSLKENNNTIETKFEQDKIETFFQQVLDVINEAALIIDCKGRIQYYNTKGRKIFYQSIRQSVSILGFLSSTEIEDLLNSIKEFKSWAGVINVVLAKDRTSIDRIRKSFTLNSYEEDFKQYVLQQIERTTNVPQLFSARAFLYPISQKSLLFIIVDNKELAVMTDEVLYGLSKTQSRLLFTIYPRHIVDYLTTRNCLESNNNSSNDISSLAMLHTNVGVMFIDIVGWTTIASTLTPKQVFGFFNELYGKFDNVLDKYKIFKLETVGDCYVAVAGLVEPADNVSFRVKEIRHIRDVVEDLFSLFCCAQGILEVTDFMTFPDAQSSPVSVRIGMHVGNVYSGIVGHQMPKFCLYGDTMNIASRMESTCQVNCLQMSHEFYTIVSSKLEELGYTPREIQVDVKGKGIMQTHICEKQKTITSNS